MSPLNPQHNGESDTVDLSRDRTLGSPITVAHARSVCVEESIAAKVRRNGETCNSSPPPSLPPHNICKNTKHGSQRHDNGTLRIADIFQASLLWMQQYYLAIYILVSTVVDPRVP